MFSYIKSRLFKEYSKLSLWYFVCFILGIITYFSVRSCALDNFTNKTIFVILLITAFLYIYFGKDILLLFTCACFSSFLVGVLVSDIRLNSVHTRLIDKVVTSYIEGTVESIKPTNRGVQLLLDNVVLHRNNTKLNKVTLQIKSQNRSVVKVDDNIFVKAKLYPLQRAILPYSYNFAFHSYMSSISASAGALGKIKILSTGREDNSLKLIGLKFIYKINEIRIFVYERLISVMGREYGNFTAAILLGESKDISEKVINDMRNSGISHILCVSGLHLSLVAAFFFISTRFMLNISNFLAYRLNVKFIAAILSILGSGAYLLLSGSNIAATRAFVMTSIFMLSILIGRTYYPMRSLFIAALILLFIRPEYIFNPSFQLSFAAVLCLISGYEISLNYRKYFLNYSYIGSSFFAYLIMNIYSTILAGVVTAPFVIYHFHKFANYSIIANLFAVPIMSFCIMPIALISLILMPINLDQYALNLLSIFIKILLWTTNYISKLSNSVTYIGYIDNVSLLIFTLGFFWLCLWQTNWRFMGICFWVVAFSIKLYKSEPDMIIDFNRKIFSVRTMDYGLKFYSDLRTNNFITDYWSSWYGERNPSIVEKENLFKKNYIFKINSGLQIAINHTKCQDADLQIITSPTLYCSSEKSTLAYNELKAFNLFLIYCDTKKCLISNYENSQDRLLNNKRIFAK